MHPVIDTTKPHSARMYDYYLGGQDHYAVDRETALKAMESWPAVRTAVRENREFLGRAVRYLVAEAGIRQFLDIGTGLPSANNVHEVAQAIAPESRIVYVDNDPIVLVHARALLASVPQGRTAYIDADLREPEESWRIPRCARRSTWTSQSRSCWWRSCTSSSVPMTRPPSWRPCSMRCPQAATWSPRM
jgi:hypothetical protein